MNRLLAIKRVAGYRAWKDWVPAADLRDFCQYNVVFGVNGTGKSTFASLLADASSDSSWSTGLSVSVQVGDQEPRDASGASDPFWSCLRVFNADYVHKNLQFADDTGSTTEPLLVLGEARVEAEKERAAASARLEEIARELPECETKKHETETKRDRLATNTARTVSEELQSAAPKYAPRSYNARVVRQLVESGVVADSKLDVAKELRTAQEAARPRCAAPASVSFSASDRLDEIEAILGERALSAVINELAERPDWSRWVEAGIALHKDETTCIFCGSDLSDERRHALEAHFDESLHALQSRIELTSRSLESVKAQAVHAVENLPRVDDIVEDLRDEYEREVGTAAEDAKDFAAGVDGLIAQLEEKRDNMFSARPLRSDTPVTDLSLRSIVSLIERHNAHVDDHDTYRSDAAARVERARVAAVAPEYEAFNSTAIEEDRKVTELKDERTRLERQLQKAAVVDLDPLPLADRLNSDLSHLLGRDDLTFSSDEPGYRIMRDGVPATHLSEGERNAISLLYFLRSLEAHDTDAASSVVIIDDPVSSLDQNSLVGASALLWARLIGRCGQLIVLTHNFELFRTWSYQLNNSGNATRPFGLYEMRSTVIVDRQGKRRREPVLVNWPYDYIMQRRLRSEYHYLFWTALHTLDDCVADPTPEKELAAAALLPNVCRRLLEAFLAFRYPAGVGNLTEQMRAVAPETVSREVRTRALRFVHTYSHNEEADVSQAAPRPETLENVRAVLEFMKAIDLEHFDGMCQALEVTYPAAAAYLPA